MKFLLLLLMLNTQLILADFKTVPEHPGQKGQPSINVNFTMGNSQEAPSKNTATSTPTQQLYIAQAAASEPQNSWRDTISKAFLKASVNQITKIAIDILKRIIIGGCPYA